MASPISEAQNRAAITDDSLAELAEAMGVDCVHLDDLTAEHAELAILGVALYPYLEPAGQNVIDGHIAGLPRGCRAAFRRARERHGRGAVIYENDSGSQRIVEGQSFDWDRLGVLAQRTEHHGIYFHYAVVGDQFVFFPTRPSRHDSDSEERSRYYYIQSARFGNIDWWTALLTKGVAKYMATRRVAPIVQRVPGASRILNWFSQKGRHLDWIALYGVIWEVQEFVPTWGDIVGTPIPEAGTSTLVIYVSNDRQDWSRRLRLDVTPSGEVNEDSWIADGWPLW